MVVLRCRVFFLSLLFQIFIISADHDTDSNDAAALKALASQWDNTPSSWVGSDPCGEVWVGIRCEDSHIIAITLSSLGIQGTFSGDIQSLTELQELDLSYNTGLTGGIPASIGSLIKLQNLILVGCSFSGEIPPAIGSMKNLVFLSLNLNKFTGNIPATIGKLSKLYWLDLADNQLTGTLPVSNGSAPGLDLLVHTKHFHFGNNQLSGEIPSKLFNSDMVLIHVLFENNKFTGRIPSTLGLVKPLEVVRLDRNSLSGSVPSNFNNLTKVAELHLSNNKLTGPLPNLTGMVGLQYLDMSNNNFDPSDAPPWLSTLPSLTTLYLEKLFIGGQVPVGLFGSSLQTVYLRDNRLNGTLDVGTAFSDQLQLIDLRNNRIELVTIGRGYGNDLLLMGNPVCTENGLNFVYCKVSQKSVPPYSTSINCVSTCPSDQLLSPNCICAYPYTGTLIFRAPSFSNLANHTNFQTLEEYLKKSFQKNSLPADSVILQNPFMNADNYLQMKLDIFPAGKSRFDQYDITRLGFILSNQTFKPPKAFGPFYFSGMQYANFQVSNSGSKKSNIAIITGAAAGAVVLLLAVIMIAFFLLRRKKKSWTHREQSQPFESWEPSTRTGLAPQLSGARQFLFQEIKKITNNFSAANAIGSGGYGKVYRGTLSDGTLVAVKRAQQGSMQGGLEFKTEIELLSRVHHKNLVSLIGFCFDQGEQMLIYEYIPNGSLKDSLSGKSGIRLDWKRRLRVAIGTARGLSYLHELANPPIVHRDIKSSNILLDNHMNAKVSDFGLSKQLGNESNDNRTHVTTQVKGTMGYLDPEYYMTQQLTEKSDVYSFGVVLLELITARQPIERGRYIVREVKAKMDRSKDLYGLDDIIDEAIGLGSLGGFEKYMNLALRCVEELGYDRPTMSEVVKEIDVIMQLSGFNSGNESVSSSSVSYERTSKDSHHPYGSDSAFDCSVGPPLSAVVPK